MIPRIANRIVLLSLVPKGSVCCEVGVLRGDYSAKILEICQPSKLILIDNWRKHLDFDSQESHEFTRQRFAAQRSTGQVEIHEGDSVTELGKLPDESLDFCYVDASHAYEAVLADLEAALPKMKAGALLAGHDFCPIVDFGVVRAVAVFCDRHRLHIDLLTDEKPIPVDRRYAPSTNWPETMAYNSWAVRMR